MVPRGWDLSITHIVLERSHLGWGAVEVPHGAQAARRSVALRLAYRRRSHIWTGPRPRYPSRRYTGSPAFVACRLVVVQPRSRASCSARVSSLLASPLPRASGMVATNVT